MSKRLPVLVVAFLLGWLAVASWPGAPKAPQVSEAVAALLEEETLQQGRSETLRTRLSALEARIIDVEGEADRDQDIAALRLQLDEAMILAGGTRLTGPGVEVTLNDAQRQGQMGDPEWYLVHDIDVLSVVNALRAGGAEAISINGVRLVAGSRIRCGGPTIHVHDRPMTPPFVITAIGDPDALMASIDQNGVFDDLSLYGVRHSARSADDLVVERHYGAFIWQHAQAALDEEGDPVITTGSEGDAG